MIHTHSLCTQVHNHSHCKFLLTKGRCCYRGARLQTPSLPCCRGPEPSGRRCAGACQCTCRACTTHDTWRESKWWASWPYMPIPLRNPSHFISKSPRKVCPLPLPLCRGKASHLRELYTFYSQKVAKTLHDNYRLIKSVIYVACNLPKRIGWPVLQVGPVHLECGDQVLPKGSNSEPKDTWNNGSSMDISQNVHCYNWICVLLRGNYQYSGTPKCGLPEMQKPPIQDTFVKSQCNRIMY